MTIRQPRYSREEHARLGTEVYERVVRPRVDPAERGKIVALDIESGEYEIGDDSLTTCNRLLGRNPEAQIWCVRVGHPAVHRFGPRVSAGTP